MEYTNVLIWIVFDYHHHRFCDGGLSEQEGLLELSYISNKKTLYQLSTIVRVVVRNDLTSQLDLKHILITSMIILITMVITLISW